MIKSFEDAENVLCYSRDGVHLKLLKETCRQDSLSVRIDWSQFQPTSVVIRKKVPLKVTIHSRPKGSTHKIISRFQVFSRKSNKRKFYQAELGTIFLQSYGSALVSMQIRIQHFRSIRTQFQIRITFWWPNAVKFYSWKINYNFDFPRCNSSIPRPPGRVPYPTYWRSPEPTKETNQHT